MPKVSDAHREARRGEILAAALRVLAARGYPRTSMADIIAESGLSAGAIYGHFPSKQELFVAVAQSVLGGRRDELAALVRSGPPPSPGEVLAVLLHGLLGSGIDAQVLVQVWGEATTEPDIRRVVNESVTTLRAALVSAVRAWFALHPEHAPEGADAAAVRLMPVMLALAQGFLVQRSILDGFDEEAYLATVCEVLPH